jgi:hypothetical protein
MTIAEPATLATDLLLAAVAATLAWRLGALARRPGLAARRWWAVAFTTTASAALAGGLWHGFRPHLPWLLERALWKSTLVAAGIASFALVAAAAFAGLAARPRRAVLIAAAAGSAVYLAWIALRDDFFSVVLDSGVALFLVFTVHLARRERAGSPAILVGVAVALLGGVVQAAHLAPHPDFNHNDLYHLIEVAAILVFYAGARRLLDFEVARASCGSSVA